jgi:hypothetical protein
MIVFLVVIVDDVTACSTCICDECDEVFDYVVARLCGGGSVMYLSSRSVIQVGFYPFPSFIALAFVNVGSVLWLNLLFVWKTGS